jgi:MFS family permease
MTHRGRLNAIAPIIMYSGFAAGPPLAGRLAERFSLAVIWPWTFLLSLAAAVLLALLHWRERATAP